MKLIIKKDKIFELDTRQSVQPCHETLHPILHPIIKHPNILTFKEWSNRYESELESIVESIHDFLRNVHEDDHRIISYNRDFLTSKMLKVIYDNSWNVYKNYSFFK